MVMGSISTDLNQFLKNRYNLHEDPVILSKLIQLDGSVSVDGENKIVLTLINIEQETTLQNSPNYTHLNAHSSIRNTPPIYINLYVLMSVFFQSSNYNESLKMLSAGISFFQQKPLFNSQNSAGLSECPEKITIEIVNLSISELSNLWGQLGGKYQPSILFKLRMLTFDGNYPVEITSSVTSTQQETARL
jgi:hypothetical protein